MHTTIYNIVNDDSLYSTGILSCFSHDRLFATLWTVTHQSPVSMGFAKQGYWSGLPCPPPEDPFDPGIEHMAPALQVDSLPLSHWGSRTHIQCLVIACNGKESVYVYINTFVYIVKCEMHVQ